MQSKQIRLMGTVIEISIAPVAQAQTILETCEQQLLTYNQIFSANDETSDLSQLNQAAGKDWLALDKDLFDLIRIGKEVSLEPGYLNIAIGPLVKLWKIGFAGARLPEAAEIAPVLTKIDADKIVLDEASQRVFLAEEGMQLDLGALAKGYFADKLVAYLKSQQVPYGLVNLGGNVLTFGFSPKSADGRWRVGLQLPEAKRGQHLLTVKVADKSVVTSGIYERFLELEGRRYHHIFDSQTGYPIETELASLTIISETSLSGEIWTSQLFGYSPQEIIAKVNQLEGIEACAITKEGGFYPSAGFMDFVV